MALCWEYRGKKSTPCYASCAHRAANPKSENNKDKGLANAHSAISDLRSLGGGAGGGWGGEGRKKPRRYLSGQASDQI